MGSLREGMYSINLISMVLTLTYGSAPLVGGKIMGVSWSYKSCQMSFLKDLIIIMVYYRTHKNGTALN